MHSGICFFPNGFLDHVLHQSIHLEHWVEISNHSSCPFDASHLSDIAWLDLGVFSKSRFVRVPNLSMLSFMQNYAGIHLHLCGQTRIRRRLVFPRDEQIHSFRDSVRHYQFDQVHASHLHRQVGQQESLNDAHGILVRSLRHVEVGKLLHKRHWAKQNLHLIHQWRYSFGSFLPSKEVMFSGPIGLWSNCEWTMLKPDSYLQSSQSKERNDEIRISQSHF